MALNVAFVRAGRATPWEYGILTELERLGYNPFFICSSYDRAVPIKYQRKGWNLRSSVFLDRILNRSMMAKGFSYAFKIRKLEYLGAFFHPSKLFSGIDILHLADESYLPAYQALKYAKRSLMTFWENIPFNFDIDYKVPTRTLRPKVLNGISHFFPVSDAAKQTLLWHGIDEERMTKVHPGIDLSLFKRSDDVQKFRDSISAGSRSIILGVSRLEYFKGLTFVLRSLKELKELNRDFLYVHVGTGPQRFVNYLHGTIQKFGLMDNVRLLGGIEYTQLPLIYSSSLVTVLPSLPTFEWEEQMGFSILEAMACGSFPVVSDTPSLAEVVPGKLGRRIPAGNHKALTEALLEVMDDEKLARAAASSGPLHVKENYNSALTAASYSKTYQKVFDQ